MARWIDTHSPLFGAQRHMTALIQVRETQVFVCARATLDRRIALGLERVEGF
eukprot:COSAG06_NODE_286_length_18312_cov_90.377752_3_plen_52_part_00